MEQIFLKYLSLSKYSKTTIDNFKENYLSHPDYPSLYAITDSLDLIGIESISATVPITQFVNLPECFVASLAINKQKVFVLVRRREDKIIYENKKGKQKTLMAEEFINIWSGLILVVELNKNRLSKNKLPIQNILFQIGLAVFILFSLSMFLKPFNIIALLYQLLAITGLFVGVIIVQEELGILNSFVTKVCNKISNTFSCNSVIGTKEKILPFGISFSDLPLLFFGVNFMVISFSHSFYVLVGFMNIMSLPIILYSVYYQKFKIKKWCVLCLFVFVIIIVQSVMYIYTAKIPKWETVAVYFSILSTITLLWLPLKDTLKKKNNLSRENNELRRFKRNSNVFNFLLNKNKIPSTNRLQGITVGNINSPFLVELFLSPSCRFCFDVYKECLDFIEIKGNKAHLKIYFNINISNTENPYIVVAKGILQYFQKKQCIEPLNDWYIDKIPMEKWNEKWGKDNITSETENLIKQQFEFCSKNNLNYAPIVLINGKLLPKEYSIKELKYFRYELKESVV